MIDCVNEHGQLMYKRASVYWLQVYVRVLTEEKKKRKENIGSEHLQTISNRL